MISASFFIFIALFDEKPIEEPWVFDVTVPTNNLEQVHLNKAVTLDSGEKITIEKVIVTPISTIIYYDAAQAKEAFYFKIVSAGGTEWPPHRSYVSNDIGNRSYSRHAPIHLEKETYFLVPYMDHNEEIGERVQIE
ncbi:DUF5643 domain-containing protein [Paenibacillus tarimensis]